MRKNLVLPFVCTVLFFAKSAEAQEGFGSNGPIASGSIPVNTCGLINVGGARALECVISVLASA